MVIWERVKFLASHSIPYAGPNPRHATIWKNRSTSLRDCLLGVGTAGVSLGTDHPHLVGMIRAQSNLLNVLEVTPLLGRNFVPADTVKGRDQVAIVAYSLWQSLFHGDSEIIGKSIRIRQNPYTVIGVLPRDFQFPKRSILSPFPSGQSATTAPPVEIVMPFAISLNEYSWNGEYGNWIALGRLKPHASVGQAESELNVITRQIVAQMPANEHIGDPDALLAYVPAHAGGDGG